MKGYIFPLFLALTCIFTAAPLDESKETLYRLSCCYARPLHAGPSHLGGMDLCQDLLAVPSLSGESGHARQGQAIQADTSHSGRRVGSIQPFRQPSGQDKPFGQPWQADTSQTGRDKPFRADQATRPFGRARPQSLPSPQPSYAVCNGLVPSTVRV